MMKGKTYILFTAGRGPIECSLAVKGVQAKFKKYLKNRNIDFSIRAQQKNEITNSCSSIIFELDAIHDDSIKPWLGTIQWVCKSPIRKFHKRKNWFLKCVQINMDKEVKLRKEDVLVQYFKASGPGGQHRNKVETAVRLTDSQTGICVIATEFRSQAQNKKRAWEKLFAAAKRIERQHVSELDFKKWSEQIEIERGKAVKIFEGLKFAERR